MIQFNPEGTTPTAAFIEDVHDNVFQELIPNVFMIKGAKNDRGFDQAYMLLKGDKEVVFIDVVEEAYRKTVENMLIDSYEIKAVLITGKAVLDDCYADLETISKDMLGPEIYIAPDIAPQDFETKPLTGRDALLSDFNLEAQEVPEKEGQVVLYCSNHGGIVFPGDSALGSAYGTEEFIFTRGREQNQKEAFAVENFWKSYKAFSYMFPRQGKPGLEVDERTRTTLLTRLAKGETEL